METFFDFLTLIGCWLLFAGAIFQAALELKDQDIKRDRIMTARRQVSVSRHVSQWWWFLPPIKLVLEKRQTRKWRREHFKLLARADRNALLDFTHRAKGWLIVSGGAFLAAVVATRTFGIHLQWNGGVIFMLALFLTCLSLLNTILHMRADTRLRS